jgi:putative ABC transport system substrate-binding protein
MAPSVPRSIRVTRWRRRFTATSAVSAALVLAWILAAAAQPTPKTVRIGVLLYSNPEADPTVATLRQGLRGLGYREGQTLAIDYRAAEGHPERLPALAAELVRLKPDLLVAIGGDVTPAAQQATATIPIVAWVSNDPVQAGFASSIPRPGRNITGVTLILDTLAGKRLALLKEVAPRITRVGIVWNPEHADPEFRECQRAAQTLGMTLQSLEVHKAADFDAALQVAIREHSETLVAVSSRLVTLHRKRLIDFAAKNRIPLVGDWGPWAENGALLAYGPSPTEMTERMVSYVDRVLKGARPGDLPFLQPTRFDLTVNTGVARSLGLTIPESVLVRADRVIQ